MQTLTHGQDQTRRNVRFAALSWLRLGSKFFYDLIAVKNEAAQVFSDAVSINGKIAVIWKKNKNKTYKLEASLKIMTLMNDFECPGKLDFVFQICVSAMLCYYLWL